MFDNSAAAEALFGTQSLKLDERWLSELASVVNFLIKGERLNFNSLSEDTKASLLNVFEKFKEDKLNLQSLTFDDPEIDATVKQMNKLTKEDMKAAKNEIKKHINTNN